MDTILKQLCEDFFPVFKKLLVTDNYGIALGGSHSKGTSDASSDYDFKLYTDKFVDEEQFQKVFGEIGELISEWRKKGVVLDNLWPRTYCEIDNQLNSWLSGIIEPVPMIWCAWGYHVLIDMHTQIIIEDTTGKLAEWKKRLDPYPKDLEKAIIAKYRHEIDHWMNDYHYKSKVDRQDYVFLASYTARFIHDILQILYAKNHVYYPGDGNNLIPTRSFKIKPDSLEERIVEILYPSMSGNVCLYQYEQYRKLYDDTVKLL